MSFFATPSTWIESKYFTIGISYYNKNYVLCDTSNIMKGGVSPFITFCDFDGGDYVPTAKGIVSQFMLQPVSSKSVNQYYLICNNGSYVYLHALSSALNYFTMNLTTTKSKAAIFSTKGSAGVSGSTLQLRVMGSGSKSAMNLSAIQSSSISKYVSVPGDFVLGASAAATSTLPLICTAKLISAQYLYYNSDAKYNSTTDPSALILYNLNRSGFVTYLGDGSHRNNRWADSGPAQKIPVDFDKNAGPYMQLYQIDNASYTGPVKWTDIESFENVNLKIRYIPKLSAQKPPVNPIDGYHFAFDLNGTTHFQAMWSNSKTDNVPIIIESTSPASAYDQYVQLNGLRFRIKSAAPRSGGYVGFDSGAYTLSSTNPFTFEFRDQNKSQFSLVELDTGKNPHFSCFDANVCPDPRKPNMCLDGNPAQGTLDSTGKVTFSCNTPMPHNVDQMFKNCCSDVVKNVCPVPLQAGAKIAVYDPREKMAISVQGKWADPTSGDPKNFIFTLQPNNSSQNYIDPTKSSFTATQTATITVGTMPLTFNCDLTFTHANPKPTRKNLSYVLSDEFFNVSAKWSDSNGMKNTTVSNNPCILFFEDSESMLAVAQNDKCNVCPKADGTGGWYTCADVDPTVCGVGNQCKQKSFDKCQSVDCTPNATDPMGTPTFTCNRSCKDGSKQCEAWEQCQTTGSACCAQIPGMCDYAKYGAGAAPGCNANEICSINNKCVPDDTPTPNNLEFRIFVGVAFVAFVVLSIYSAHKFRSIYLTNSSSK